MTPPRAYMVVDLGYGDAGKGTVVDWLVRRTGAPLVVRFNGGPQAAHNVVLPGGQRHAFATWGAGTFAGAATYLGPRVFVNPLNAFREAEHLKALGIQDPFSRLLVDTQCPVITPWHVYENRARETLRGGDRHGSCGEGVGAARRDLEAGYVLRAGDLAHLPPRGLALVLTEIKERKLADLRALGPDVMGTGWWHLAKEEDPVHIASEFSVFASQVRIDSRLTNCRDATGPLPVIFEGAQGVLIDETHGFGAPAHATWSNCTFDNAEAIRAEHFADLEPVRLGVSRTYMVRHGPGPFPTEDPALDDLPELDNREGPWQGKVRRGWPDFRALAYAIDVCGGVDALAVTHLDVPLNGRWHAGRGEPWEWDPIHAFRSLGVPVVLGSWGPTYQEKTENPAPGIDWTHLREINPVTVGNSHQRKGGALSPAPSSTHPLGGDS